MSASFFKRRTVLKAVASAPLLGLVPDLGIEAAVARQRKFLILMAAGGWDTTLVFEPRRRSRGIDLPPQSRPAVSGDLRWMSSATRPCVDRFFNRWGHRAVIVNGIHTRCAGHDAAANLLLTGDVAAGAHDWPTLLARAEKPMPMRVVPAETFTDALSAATRRLESGASRCEFLGIPGAWDTHDDNARQGPLFEAFFDGMDRLFTELSRTRRQHGPCLLDETVIAAVSEIGRAPRHNASGGKHHWPVTSALFAGAGIAGGQVIGATSDGLEALPVNFATGQAARSGTVIHSENLAASILELGGLAGTHRSRGVEVLRAMLAR